MSEEYTFEEVELRVDKVGLMINGTLEFELEVGQKESWGHHGGDPPIDDHAGDIKCTSLDSITSEDEHGNIIEWAKMEWFPSKEKFLKDIRQAIEGLFEGDDENEKLVEYYKNSNSEY